MFLFSFALVLVLVLLSLPFFFDFQPVEFHLLTFVSLEFLYFKLFLEFFSVSSHNFELLRLEKITRLLTTEGSQTHVYYCVNSIY